MRSSEPMPGNPWPHDMVITVESHDHRICELLWARDVYRIPQQSADEPPPIWPEPQLPPERMPPGAVRRSWGPLWMRHWHEALAWYATQDTDVDPTLRSLAMQESVSAEDLMAAVGPTTWSEAVGDELFDRAAFSRWEQDAVDLVMSAHEVGGPEDAALPALVEAWRRGLTRVVEIPTVGEYTRTLGTNTLLVTAATRGDPDAYALALTSFRLVA